MFALRSFQSKLFVAYAFFILFFTLTVSLPMYFYLHGDIEKNISISAEQVVAGIAGNLDLYGLQYANMTKQIYLAADNTGTTPIQYLDILNADPSEIDRFKARLAIENFMNLNLEIFPDVRRISIFRENGEFISNLLITDNAETAFNDARYLPTKSAKGAPLVRYDERDHWSARSETPYFSFSRLLSLSGTEQGYFDVQIPASKVLSTEQLNNLPKGNLWIMSDSEVLFSFAPPGQTNEPPERLPNLIQAFGNPGEDAIVEHRDREYFIMFRSEKTGLYVVYATLGKTLFAPLNTFRNVTIVSVLLLILLSLTIFYLLTRTLTSPLFNLKKAIDTVELGEPTVTMENKYRMDEIELLNRAFRRMNERLQNSLQETIRFRTMQLRTHFEKLQSQINPHFLFNMLGVITGMAEKENASGIAVIGKKLADFLRYATNTEASVSNMEKEMKCVRDYLELMKSRYLHRLRYTIDIPPDLHSVPIPVLSLQPLVENCIQHGYHPRTKELAIEITGFRHADGKWEIIIKDNGAGFDPDVLDKLRNEIETYVERLHDPEYDLGFGGMGLISSFARLKFLHKNRIGLSFGNNPDQGAFVRIEGPAPIRPGRVNDEDTDRG